MLQALFNGISGLLTFTKGLSNVSNNVSNMNTPGFRGSDSFYRSIHGEDGEGVGAMITDTETRTTPGEARQSGNNSDVAINGSGFFILKDDNGKLAYTRAGQFQFDRGGYLIDPVTQRRVSGIDASGRLKDINIKNLQTLPPKPTTRIEMTGSLARSGPSDLSDHITAISVFDTTGSKHALSMELQPVSVPSNGWEVTVSDENGLVVGSGTIAFNADGSPTAGFNTLSASLSDGAQSILFDFGSPGSFTLASQAASAAAHTLGARVTDGSATASLSSYSFDENGVLKLTYSNGEKRDGQQLALAWFADESSLIAGQGSLLTPPKSMPAEYGRAGEGRFGSIQGGYLEASNVDLTQEFGDILIIQRGYQASSRVMTVANEMLEQLYNGTRGG